MRRLAILALLICCTSAFAQKWTREKGAPPQPATEAYFSRVGNIIFHALLPELAKYPERLSGAIRVALRIDRRGGIQVQKIVSTTSNRCVQDTLLHVVRTVKLPPMPKQVVAEQGHDWVDFQDQWSFERHD